MGEWELGTFRLPPEAAEVSQRAHSESEGQDRLESELDHKPKRDELASRKTMLTKQG